jgi:hypothetical protein
MANTTNYNWETPDDTDLVKDGALAIRTLGSSIDTTTKALNPSTTLGDIEYRSATANTNTRLGIGSTGNVLTVAGGVPTWAAPAGGSGKILQVVQATTTTPTTIASTSFTDTTLTASITPSSTSSRILVIVNQFMFFSRSSSFMGVGLSLLRGATEIYTNSSLLNAGLMATGNGTASEMYHYTPLSFIDSPSSTSSLTYKTQGAVYTTANGGTSTWQRDNVQSSIILMEIGA